MAAVDPQDNEDIRTVLAGDPAAFQGLLSRHGQAVHDLARRILRDAHEAEDATQQVFLNAFKALARFDPQRPFRHWILRITTNWCRNRLARKRVRRHLLEPVGGDEERMPDPEAPPLDTQDPLVRARLEEALGELPEKYRTVMVLRYVHDLPLVDIASITETSMATLKTHLHRGRARLRALLEPPETDAATDGMEN